MIFFRVFAGKVDAVRDLWIISDKFLYDNFAVLVEIKNKAQVKKIAKPFVCDFFNVTSFMANPMAEMGSVLVHILNALIMDLNDNKKLPRILLVVPDRDILEYINYYQSGKSHIIGSSIKWLVNNIDCTVTCKKENLKHLCPGAIAAAEPKIIWIKMLTRSYHPYLSQKKPVDNLVHIYNKILEEILSTRQGHFILDVNTEMQGLSSFTINRQLSRYGKVKFWREVDKIIGKYDRYEISLRPLSLAEKEKQKRKLQQQQSTPAGDKMQQENPTRFRYFKKNKHNNKKQW